MLDGIAIASGLGVGLIVGITGVGGGSLMTPILVLLFGQSPAVAVGTDLVFSASTKLVATVSFGYNHRIDWRIVGRLALGSIPGAGAVAVWFWLTRSTPGVIDTVIAHALAIILAIAAAALLVQYPLRRLGVRLTAKWLDHSERYRLPLTIAAGLMVGVGVTLTSVGAGTLGVVALLALYPLRLFGDRLVATDIAHALPVTLIAAVSHALLHHVDTTVLIYLLVGSIPGVVIASRLAIRLPPQLTNTFIALMLAAVSARMLLQSS